MLRAIQGESVLNSGLGQEARRLKKCSELPSALAGRKTGHADTTGLGCLVRSPSSVLLPLKTWLDGNEQMQSEHLPWITSATAVHISPGCLFQFSRDLLDKAVKPE